MRQSRVRGNPNFLLRKAQDTTAKAVGFRLALRLEGMTAFGNVPSAVVPVLCLSTLGIHSEIYFRVLVSQVTKIGSRPQRFACCELNQLRGKKFASVLMNVCPKPIEQRCEIAVFDLGRECRNCCLGFLKELDGK